MAQRHFGNFNSLFHYAFVDQKMSNVNHTTTYDSHYPIVRLIDRFKKNRKGVLSASVTKVLDKTTFDFCPKT